MGRLADSAKKMQNAFEGMMRDTTDKTQKALNSVFDAASSGARSASGLGSMSYAQVADAPNPPTAAVCPKCGTSVAENQKFCPKCGASVSKPLKCTGCETLIVTDDPFCVYCGTFVPQGNKCLRCGTELVKDQQYCHRCGYDTHIPQLAE